MDKNQGMYILSHETMALVYLKEQVKVDGEIHDIEIEVARDPGNNICGFVIRALAFNDCLVEDKNMSYALLKIKGAIHRAIKKNS